MSDETSQLGVPGQMGAPLVAGYDDLTLVGRGGFATVFRANEAALGREVALKILTLDLGDQRSERRFQRECEATAKLTAHPNVITLLGSGRTDDGRAFIALPYCPEGSLHDRLTRDGPIPPGEVIEIGAKLARALADVHSAGFIHRDLKPQNILVTPWGEPALADFGIATVLDAQNRTSATDSLTPMYTAPEILQGDQPTPASDVYGFGSTLFALVAGSPPFHRGDDEGIYPMLSRVLTEPAPLAGHGAPPELEDLLRETLAKDPVARPSITEVADRLAALAGGDVDAPSSALGRPVRGDETIPRAHLASGDIGASAVADRDATRSRRGRRQIVVGFSIVAVAAVVGAALLAARGTDERTDTRSDAGDPSAASTEADPGDGSSGEEVSFAYATGDAPAVAPSGLSPVVTPLSADRSYADVGLFPVLAQGSSIWLAEWGVLNEVDVATGETLSTIEIPAERIDAHYGTQADQGLVWLTVSGPVASGGAASGLARVDIRTGTVEMYGFDGDLYGIRFEGGDVWVEEARVDSSGFRLTRIGADGEADPPVVIPDDDGPWPVPWAADGSTLWWTDPRGVHRRNLDDGSDEVFDHPPLDDADFLSDMEAMAGGVAFVSIPDDESRTSISVVTDDGRSVTTTIADLVCRDAGVSEEGLVVLCGRSDTPEGSLPSGSEFVTLFVPAAGTVEALGELSTAPTSAWMDEARFPSRPGTFDSWVSVVGSDDPFQTVVAVDRTSLEVTASLLEGFPPQMSNYQPVPSPEGWTVLYEDEMKLWRSPGS